MLSLIIGILDHLRRRGTLLLGHRQVRQRIPLGRSSQIVGSADLPGGYPSTAVAVGGNQLAIVDRQFATDLLREGCATHALSIQRAEREARQKKSAAHSDRQSRAWRLEVERLTKKSSKVDLRRDKNFYGHPGEGAGATDEAAGHWNRLPDTARDRDRDQIEAAEATIRRIECDPAGSRYEDLSSRMG